MHSKRKMRKAHTSKEKVSSEKEKCVHWDSQILPKIKDFVTC